MYLDPKLYRLAVSTLLSFKCYILFISFFTWMTSYLIKSTSFHSQLQPLTIQPNTNTALWSCSATSRFWASKVSIFSSGFFSSKPGNARQGLNEVQSTTVGSIHLQVEILVTAKVSYSNHPQKEILINPLDCWNFKPIWQILWEFTAKADGKTLDLANWMEVILEAFILPALSANPCLSTRTLSSGAASWQKKHLDTNG